MIKSIDLKLLPKDLYDEALLLRLASEAVKLPTDQITAVKVRKRSIDARGKQPLYRLQVEVYVSEVPVARPTWLSQLSDVATAGQRCIIVGAGPAGYFAALELIARGIRPIVLDRGKDVRARRRDLKAIQQAGVVDADSNYCFGEGGAGTYSDGKLYTRSHKRGNIEKTLELLVEHGATPDILVDAHPHIGTNKLPQIVSSIRATIEAHGGEVHFGSKVTDLILHRGAIEGVVVNEALAYRGDAVILATGHSARDIFELLHRKGITIEAKPFALGVRVEHPQSLIDAIQYHQPQRDPNLPASSYKLVHQVKDRGVFSFCMCPGGLVVPAATAPGEIVVNGMSPSRRDSPFANSGTVVAVELSDLPPQYAQYGVFAGMMFQRDVEQAMFGASDGTQRAPAQRMTDFVKGKVSGSLPATSYIPGLQSANVRELLPPFIGRRLQEGILAFGKKMKGYFTEEANVIGTESRTSSPIRIPRDRETYMHADVRGLFPCGEGAGYAGGILSAAMDGQNVAKAVEVFLRG